MTRFEQASLMIMIGVFLFWAAWYQLPDRLCGTFRQAVKEVKFWGRYLP